MLLTQPAKSDLLPLREVQDLVYDLVGGQLALEPNAPGGAESARERAAGLRADAEAPVRAEVQAHGLDPHLGQKRFHIRAREPY